ncbi:hypothetical protein DFH08DRAFT_976664 [Mycena albidolilacea]|uniref:Uncharacterized protein n=1 Tax=Mycena albidolilacea TaxID=1033008 RepID=A0AAD6Z2Q1_9AGAR|nr:hypothetical protein DFH08DRAFT_976664 [Mycena albidolilacea]
MAPSLIAVNLATLAVGSLFYGMYLVLFFLSMHLLLRRYNATHTSHKSRQHSSIFKSTVFVSAILLFVTVTVHWTTIVYRAFVAFVALQHGVEAEAFFNDHTQLTEGIQNGFMALAILIGDSLIIHRLWVVSRSKLVLAVPVACLTALTGEHWWTSAQRMTHATTEVSSFVSLKVFWNSADVFANPLLKMNSLLTLFTNVYCTGEFSCCITWKIWTITKFTAPSDGINLRHFVVIVVESAGLYAFWAIFFAVAYEAQSNLQSSVIQTAPALVGIVNALIQTRVGLGWTSEQTEKSSWPSSPLMFADRNAVEE